MFKNLLFKVTLSLVLLIQPCYLLLAQQENRYKDLTPVKNVIVMISDGTSISSVSLARWYQRMVQPEKLYLNLDPFLCGTILTYCSESPIGDSAPTTSTYMNGVPSIAGFVGTYPYITPEDVVPLDSTMAYRPILSLFEAGRILKGKKVGLVVTSEFPHATPSDCMAHCYNRKRYDLLVPQLAQNGVDVLYAGGTSLITPEIESLLQKQGVALYRDDFSALSSTNDKVWGLYGRREAPWELDRDPNKAPSLAQMTEAAIKQLENPNGFCLMVEGSKVDWAAHNNDPVGIATEFLAFDEAVKVAMDFAQKDKNTIVVITSDHGNSGLSLGSKTLGRKYAHAPKSLLFGPLTKIKKSSAGMAEILYACPEDQIAQTFKQYASFELKEPELAFIKAHIKAKKENKKITDILTPDQLKTLPTVEYNQELYSYIATIYSSRTHLAFTTHGHTAEEVILGAYAPSTTHRIEGMNTNIDLHNYLRASVGISDSMLELTEQYFAPHTDVFKEATYTITGEKDSQKTLTVNVNGNSIIIHAFNKYITVNGKEKELPLTPIYVDKTNTFYLPRSIQMGVNGKI